MGNKVYIEPSNDPPTTLATIAKGTFFIILIGEQISSECGAGATVFVKAIKTIAILHSEDIKQ